MQFLFTGLAVGFTILSVVLLVEKAGEIFLLACLGALVFWAANVQLFYDRRRRFLLYSDRVVVKRFWPWPAQSFAFSAIRGVDIEIYENYGFWGNSKHEDIRLYFSSDRRDSELLDTDDPQGLYRQLTDLLERYRATHPSRVNLRRE